jgi:hypothetical protein
MGSINTANRMIVLNRCIALNTDDVRKHFPPSQTQQIARLNVGRAEKLPEREILHKGFFEAVQRFEISLLDRVSK